MSALQGNSPSPIEPAGGVMRIPTTPRWRGGAARGYTQIEAPTSLPGFGRPPLRTAAAAGAGAVSPLQTPAYPQQPEGVTDSLPDGQPWPWRLQQIGSLDAAHPSQPGTLFCRAIPGGLFRSDDCGASWMLVRSLWITEDQGDSWQLISRRLPPIYRVRFMACHGARRRDRGAARPVSCVDTRRRRRFAWIVYN
ncbi:hypothetical protein WMF45_10340 [Sorangium sp. So ce448]|uniref:hypothetical protein n=1 Tax=Sorangium sp. So ce448 TaxID=3133314 RepID=UPI003F5EB16F